jgi:hypothetical protein
MNYPFRFTWKVLLVFIVASFNVQAEELTDNSESKNNIEDRPDIGFLEFLGEWETDSGEWIDPNQLEEKMAPEKENGQENESL